MNKIEFLAAFRSSREQWEAQLARVDPRRLTEPGAAGAWSPTDIIAHVTWHEREMVGVLRTRVFAGSDWWDLPTDQRNSLIYAANQDRPLLEVLAEARQVFADLQRLAQALTDEDLNNPARFAGMPPDWLPWQVLAGNTFEHYDHHAADISAWLEDMPG